MTARLCVAIVALCAACAAPPPPPAPAGHARLAEMSARAASLVQAGDPASAADQYEEALRFARSIDDADAVAAQAINLSIVYQRLGRHAAARAALDLVLDEPRRAFPERRQVQAELRAAILDLAARDAARAAARASRALERCARIDCGLEPAIVNVQAYAALYRGDMTEAARLAQSAEAWARRRADVAERANALRTLGRARSALGEAENAIAALEQALALDRTLADPRKIHADLTALERAAAAKGDTDAARGYAARAQAIERARKPAAREEAGMQLRLP